MKKSVTRKNGVLRFGVSMPVKVGTALDDLVKRRGYANRSQALTDLVRACLVEDFAAAADHEIAGTITLIYDHHKRDLQNRLTDIQHDSEGLIISALHVHLDHHNCMETIVVRGAASAVRQLADQLIVVKGIKHGKLTVTTTGKEFSE